MDLIFNVVYNLTKGLLFFIDNIVYSFIPILYKLLLYLANVDLLTNNVPIQSLVKRIYILVGVFMLFRLSFSIVNYIIYPESFSDQSKGFSNLVKRSLLALVLLVGIPWFFTMAYFVQGKIISSNIIPRLILGNGGAVDQKLEDSIETSAVDLQFLVFGPFFSLNYNSSGSGGSSGDLSSGDLAICKPTEEAPMLNIIGSSDMASNKSGCLTQVARLMDNDPTVKSSHVTIENFFRSSDEQGNVVDYRRFKAFGGLLSWTLSDGEFAIKYYPIVSTICGGYLVLLLISFCIDVAARAIKLLFLQILSPIAVISSLDPTSSGDRLKEWWKECLTIWASLFIRLIVIFLIIQLTRVISNSIYNGNLISTSGLNGTKGMIGWLYLFLILGIFTAAKKIPDLIEKATGMKMSGDLELNPLKALGENKGVGLLGTGIGIGATAVTAGAVNTLAGVVERKGIIGTAGSALGGFFGGGYRSLRGAMNGEKGMKNFSNAFGSAMFARQQREDLNRRGSTWHGRLMADVNRHLGLMNRAQQQELDYSRDESALNERSRLLDDTRREVAHEKEEAESPFKNYSSAVEAIDQMISNRKEVSDAEKLYEEAKATGDDAQIQAALQLIDDAKAQEFRKMLTDPDDQNHRRLLAYRAEIDRIRAENATIRSWGDPIDDTAQTFSKTSMYRAQDEVARIEYEYSTGVERRLSEDEYELAHAKSDLAARKATPEWQANELDNSSRAVKSPQPEGWKPTGEISGAYGPQYGPGVWGGRHGGGPGGPGRGRP